MNYFKVKEVKIINLAEMIIAYIRQEADREVVRRKEREFHHYCIVRKTRKYKYKHMLNLCG